MNITDKEYRSFVQSSALIETEMIFGRIHTLIDEFNIKGVYDELFVKDDPDVSVEYYECGKYIGAEHVEAFFDYLQKLLSDQSDKHGYMDFYDVATPCTVVSEDGKYCRTIWSSISPKAKKAIPCDEPAPILTAFWHGAKLDITFKRVKGEWKILNFHISTMFTTPYDKGWIKQQECFRTPTFWDVNPDEAPTYTLYHPDQTIVKGSQYNYTIELPEKL